MALDILLGLQWGDEGKGKIVDVLAPQYDVVARFQGGPNAGHTLEFDGIKHVLHQIPSGIFRRDIVNVIGNGVVLDPVIFQKEINALAELQIDYHANLFISRKTQLILPTHRLLDAAYEKAKGKSKIGSTLKGIGPCYQDKIARVGLRIGDIVSHDFHSKYEYIKTKHGNILQHYHHHYDQAEFKDYENQFFKALENIKLSQLVDSEYFINDTIRDNKSVLAEGAQGSMLDVDFGSYPFVTSSTTMAAGACTGLGVAPNRIGQIFGIFKAYCTRVGAGPFPTELFDEAGEKLRKEGREFGATTGRPRRCGWLDLPALKYTIMINGVTQLFMMKADILNIFDEIKVCTNYKLPNGEVVNKLPYDITNTDVQPVYKTLKGWKTSLDGISDYKQLPIELINYIDFLENQLNVPINIISTGPDRTQTILKSGIRHIA